MSRIRCPNTTVTAQSVLQVMTRNYSSAAPKASMPLEFLAPRAAYPSVAISRVASRLQSRRTLPNGLRHSVVAAQVSKRHFTSSPAWQATRSILNTQKDEEGNEMMLEITDRAAQRLSQIMEKDKNPNLALRIQVESGGCHGFQYLMSLITLPAEGSQEWSSVVNEEDTIFQYLPDDANPETASKDGPKIILDEPSLDLLKGSKVDFTMELIGSQFKIVDNPYATSSCGCGTSFDIKM